MDHELFEKIRPFVNILKAYHRHEIFGLEHFPKKNRILVVANHSLATYDMLLLGATIAEHSGRMPRSLADHLFYKVPYLGELMERAGAKEGNQENAIELLEQDEIVMVAPGGMREALRPSSQRYQILWERRKGFIKLSILTQSPIVLAMCPKADDIFEVYENPFTKFIYKKFRLPAVLAKGFGPSIIPKPVKLLHFLSKPIMPPKAKQDPNALRAQVNAFHKKVTKEANELMARAIAYRKG